jgi:ornithine--oxo-acid transaminase
LASAVGIAALEVVTEDKLSERAEKLGERFRAQLQSVQKTYPDLVKEVRGRGLLNAVELFPSGLGNVSTYDVCLRLKERGILAKPTHDTIIRLSPPLTIRYYIIALLVLNCLLPLVIVVTA